MRRPSFRSCEKKAKARRGSCAEELQAPRARFRSKRPHPRTPFFTGEQDRVMHHPLSGVEVSRHSKPLFFAAALLAVVVTCQAHGTRLLPTGHLSQALYRGPQRAMPLSVSAAAAQGCQTVPVISAPVHRRTHRRASERFSLDLKNRFFWRLQKKWFLVNTVPKALAFG